MNNSRFNIVNAKRWIIFIHDLAWIPVSITSAYWLRFNMGALPQSMWPGALELMAGALVIHGATFRYFSCYRGMWRYASIPDFIRLFKAVAVGAPLTALACFVIWRLDGIPRSVLLLYPFILVGTVAAARVAYRAYKDHGFHLDFGDRQRALLVGAGRAGEMLVRDLEAAGQFQAVAFVDDNPSKQGHDIRGIRVVGTTNDILSVLSDYDIQIVLITMPSASRDAMSKIVTICAQRGIKCRTLPSLASLANGRIEVARLRAVTVEDLLGREPVMLDKRAVSKFLHGKRVLVTGGGGSIGAELCRQICQHEPSILVIVDNCEYNLYRIDQELGNTKTACVYSSVLGDVRDADVIDNIFERVKPDVVFHAAAYKHVPMVEENIVEGIRNNVIGTRNVADAAKRHRVNRFVLISTDKTVNPTNVMGATKRVAELYCQALDSSAETQFITTRFGNVLASAGSVVPLFERQIASGGPVTVTHPDITRYFMTIPEAASLILQAGAIGNGGDIFVLDMGESVRIRDLAEKMIELSGLQPGHDIQIVYTGLRPGEKMHEELFYDKEQLQGTAHPKLLLANSSPPPFAEVLARLDELIPVMQRHDGETAKTMLCRLVPEFQPQTATPVSENAGFGNKLYLVKH